jgi:lipid II:glycine glycyltransferase (peptidoglycan interpeptide bridge formation enzyme)
VSFAWGINHGSHVTYEAGASARRKDVGNFPLGYAPMWDLVTWAKESACRWFDFGGITSGDRSSQDDPFGGISSFKRSFSDEVVEVGEEWALHPNPVRTSIASFLTSVVRMGRNRGNS